MGMYTGLRVKCKLKPEFVEVIRALHEISGDVFEQWDFVAQKFPQYSFLAEWSEVGRADFIPFGSICYMPEEWGDTKWSLEGDIWSFACSLKNYECEIEDFLAVYFPKMIVSLEMCQTRYEEADCETDWTFSNGQINPVGGKTGLH